MTLSDIFSQANHIEGAFLDLGYGYGKDCKEIYNLMYSNAIPRRNFLLVDRFLGKNQGIWQNAYDQINEVKNRLKKDGSYLSVDITKDTITPSERIAIANIDLGENTYKGLQLAASIMANKGIIVVRGTRNDPILWQVDKFVQSKETLSEAYHTRDFSYIVVGASLSTVKNKQPKRTRSVLT